jgi:hypothetical protein
MPELLTVILAGMVMTAIAVPVIGSALASMNLNSVASAISGAVSKTRYQAIMNSQTYTLTITTPANTYVVKNVSTNTASLPTPLPEREVAINGGTSGTYAFTLCPNGTVYGAGGTCPTNTTPPVLRATYQGKQITITVSSVGNVIKTNY